MTKKQHCKDDDVTFGGMKARIDDWWDRYGRDEFSSTGLAQVDIDELDPDPPSAAVAAGLRYLEFALEAVSRSGASALGLLTVPLPWSEALDTQGPRLDTLLRDEWTYGPGQEVPGIYLLAQDRRPSDVEGGHWHNITDTGPTPPGYTALYRCWQVASTGGSREYARCVYIESDPSLATDSWHHSLGR